MRTRSASKRSIGEVDAPSGGEEVDEAAAKRRGSLEDVEKGQLPYPKTCARDVPGYLMCIINRELFRYPVVIDSGHTYEHRAIFDWFMTLKRDNEPLRDPLTKVLVSDKMMPNFLARQAVQKFLDENLDYVPSGWKTRDLPRIVNYLKLVIDGDLEGVKFALKHCPADVNTFNNQMRSLIWLAATTGNAAMVELLVESGADVNAKDENDLTPLHAALISGHEHVARMLLANGADGDAKLVVGWTPLHLAALKGYASVAEALLEKTTDVNAKDERNFTCLHYAVYHGHEHVAKLLLENGLDVEAKDNLGCTPLHYAAAQGHAAVTKLLLDKGAVVNAREKFNLTPLDIAERKCHMAVVELLRV